MADIAETVGQTLLRFYGTNADPDPAALVAGIAVHPLSPDSLAGTAGFAVNPPAGPSASTGPSSSAADPDRQVAETPPEVGLPPPDSDALSGGRRRNRAMVAGLRRVGADR